MLATNVFCLSMQIVFQCAIERQGISVHEDDFDTPPLLISREEHKMRTSSHAPSVSSSEIIAHLRSEIDFKNDQIADIVLEMKLKDQRLMTQEMVIELRPTRLSTTRWVTPTRGGGPTGLI